MNESILNGDLGYIDVGAHASTFAVDFFPPDGSYITLMFFDEDEYQMYINTTRGMTNDSVKITYDGSNLDIEEVR